MGLRDGIPIFLGYMAVSIAFGIMAVGNGLSVVQTAMISVTNFTSAGQFAGLTLIVGSSTYLEMALTQLVVNLRYSLMTATLSQKIGQGTPFFHRFLIATGVSDEVFGLLASREGELSPAYAYGLILISMVGWTTGTLIGAVSGNVLPHNVVTALGIALYGMFIAIIVPPARDNRVIRGLVVTSMGLSAFLTVAPGLRGIPVGFRIILVTLLVAGVAAWRHPIEVEAEREGQADGE